MADQLTEAQIRKCKDTFRLFDINGDNQITVEEFTQILRSYGKDPTEAEVQKMINEVDEDGSGTISFDEFLKVMERILSSLNSEAEIREAFRMFDKDKDGFISLEELRHVLTKVGERLSEEEISDIFSDADVDHDGRLNYEEFINMLQSKHND